MRAGIEKMSLKYNVQLNNGVEAFGTGKSITANEVCETADNLPFDNNDETPF